MDISIIIGLLIALVIVCATTVVNNIINKDYKKLNDKWKDRQKTISNFVYNIGALNERINQLIDSDETNKKTKEDLIELKQYIESIKFRASCYEYDNF